MFFHPFFPLRPSAFKMSQDELGIIEHALKRNTCEVEDLKKKKKKQKKEKKKEKKILLFAALKNVGKCSMGFLGTKQ